MFKKNVLWSTIAILIIATMLLSACGAAPAEEPVVEEPARPRSPAARWSR